MNDDFSQADYEAYLDEALPPDVMTAIEDKLRENPELGQQLRAIYNRRDAGIHTLGEIWRRHRLSCPTRGEIEKFLDGELAEDHLDYIKFHLEQIKCRLCVASHEDLQLQREHAETEPGSVYRRQRFLEKSSTYLRRKK